MTTHTPDHSDLPDLADMSASGTTVTIDDVTEDELRGVLTRIGLRG